MKNCRIIYIRLTYNQDLFFFKVHKTCFSFGLHCSTYENDTKIDTKSTNVVQLFNIAENNVNIGIFNFSNDWF